MGNVSSPIHTISIWFAPVSPHIHFTCRALQVKLLTEHHQSFIFMIQEEGLHTILSNQYSNLKRMITFHVTLAWHFPRL